MFSPFNLYIPEELSTAFHILCHPKPVENIDCTLSLRLSLPKPTLPVPNLGLQLYRTTQVVCVIDHVQLGVFEMSLCVAEPAFIAKQLRQFTMNPKQVVVPIKRGSNSEGYLKMVNGLPYPPPGSIYLADWEREVSNDYYSNDGTHVKDLKNLVRVQLPGGNHFFIFLRVETLRNHIPFAPLGKPRLNVCHCPTIEDILY